MQGQSRLPRHGGYGSASQARPGLALGHRRKWPRGQGCLGEGINSACKVIPRTRK
jgi:hypothetical protein